MLEQIKIEIEKEAANVAKKMLDGVSPEQYVKLCERRKGLLDAAAIIDNVLKRFEDDDITETD